MEKESVKNGTESMITICTTIWVILIQDLNMFVTLLEAQASSLTLVEVELAEHQQRQVRHFEF